MTNIYKLKCDSTKDVYPMEFYHAKDAIAFKNELNNQIKKDGKKMTYRVVKIHNDTKKEE